MIPTTVGLDLAKNIFHIHVADASGHTIDSKKLARRELLPFFEALDALMGQLDALNQQIDSIDARLAEIHKSNAICRLLATVPGIGPITATAFAATIPDPSAFRSGREFAAWLGLTPRQNSSGGKTRLGGITK